MTRHYNPSIVQHANRILASKGGDFLSDEVMPNIQPVIPISPVANISRGSGMTNALTSALFTTPADKDFYLTSAVLSVSKDVTSTAVAIDFRVVIDGASQTPIRISGITLTPLQATVPLVFNPPIKIDRNTAISINANTAVANIRVDGSLTGYTEEVTR